MEKSPDAFRTISEVSELLGTPTHVLRFWETRFTQIRPVKRAGGRRYYRPSDVALLGGIRRLLHDDGVTIRGVQKILREQGVRHVAALSGLQEVADDTVDVEGIDAAREAHAVSAGTAGAPDAPAEEEGEAQDGVPGTLILGAWESPVDPAPATDAPAELERVSGTAALPSAAAEPPAEDAAPGPGAGAADAEIQATPEDLPLRRVGNSPAHEAETTADTAAEPPAPDTADSPEPEVTDDGPPDPEKGTPQDPVTEAASPPGTAPLLPFAESLPAQPPERPAPPEAGAEPDRDAAAVAAQAAQDNLAARLRRMTPADARPVQSELRLIAQRLSILRDTVASAVRSRKG